MLSHPVVDAVAVAPVNLPLVFGQQGPICSANIRNLSAFTISFYPSFDFRIQEQVIESVPIEVASLQGDEADEKAEPLHLAEASSSFEEFFNAVLGLDRLRLRNYFRV